MADQGTLDFDAEDQLPELAAGLVPETYSTSKAAARSVATSKETQRRLVFEAIRAAGDDGCTDEELQLRLHLDGSSERPRRWELWKLKRIAVRHDADGFTVRRLTRTGRHAVVWVAEQKAG